MEKELFQILTAVQIGTLGVEDAQNQIFNLFRINRNSILQGGDQLNEYGEGHREDAERIKTILIKNEFINAGLNDAIRLWGEYSDSYAAGWLGLPDDDDEIYNCIKGYIRTTHYCD